MADELELGPVDYLVIEFPGNKMTGEGFPILVDLVERGIIRILDLAFITRGADGAIDAVDIRDFDGAGIGQLAVFHRDGEPGLLDQSDFDEIGAVLDLNSSAGILVFENTWAAPFASRDASIGRPARGERSHPGDRSPVGHRGVRGAGLSPRPVTTEP